MSWARPEDAARWQEEFGRQLRELRLERGLSQMALAAAADLDPTYVSAVEQGRRNLGLVNIRVLAATLNVPVAALFCPDPK